MILEKPATPVRSVASRQWVCMAIAVLVVVTAALRVVSTYTVFSETRDEAFHIASGMEWLDKGTYTYEWLHPPIGRVFLALGPYLKGMRSFSLEVGEDEGHAILASRQDYRGNLALARAGNLVALFLAGAVMFAWARRWFSSTAGVISLILFFSLPPVLGHAGLATLDVFCVAGLMLALYNFLRWLETPTVRRAVGLGAAVSFAILVKFSNIGFLVVCGALALMFWYPAAWPKPSAKIRERCVQMAVVSAVILFLIWAAYRFPLPGSTSVVTYFNTHHPRGMGSGRYAKLMTPPAPILPFVAGVKELIYDNKVGHESYLLGRYSRSGWWYFFPVVLFFKTPLAFLILALCALFAVLRMKRYASWQLLATAAFPIAILLICMASRINLGVRHVLAVYPFMALIAGNVLYTLFAKRTHQVVSVIAGLLVCAVVVEGWLAYPDYIAYFNQLAGDHPGRILSESDLDWGQDLYRLADRVQDLGIRDLTLGYFGPTLIEEAGITNYRPLDPFQKSSGWIAVSARMLTLDNARDGSYGWLKQYTPTERVGKSIWLYHIDR